MEEPTNNTMAQDFAALVASLGRPRKAFSEHLMCMQPPQMAGEQEAYEEFFARLNRSVLLRIAAPIVHYDPDAAEDVVQQALLRAYRHLIQGQSYAAPRKQFQHLKNVDPEHASLDLNLHHLQIQNPAAWLYTIVSNTARNYVRKRKMALVSLEDVMREAERQESCFAQPERDTIRQQQAQELRRYVAALPYPFADIVRLHSFEGQPLQEVADMLGYQHGTVRVYADRARKMLKALLLGEAEIVDGKLRKKRRRRR